MFHVGLPGHPIVIADVGHPVVERISECRVRNDYMSCKVPAQVEEVLTDIERVRDAADCVYISLRGAYLLWWTSGT